MKLSSILRTTLAVITAAASLTLHAQQQYQWTNFVGKPGGQGNVDGPALTKARFRQPRGIAQDAAGNLFIADSSNHTIRKVTPAGIVSTLAGKAGAPGGTDGTGASARFFYPVQLVVGPGGYLYVADSNNYCVRKISPAGVVTTLAGKAGQSGAVDGTGAAARFGSPYGIAVDASGNVFVAEYGNHAIRKVTSSGVVTTLAGLATVSGSADGTGTAARFNYPQHLAIAGGFLYVADQGNQTIRKVSMAGEVTTFAGMAGSIGSADGTGGTARFSDPTGLASDGSGNLYVGENGNPTLRKITPAGVVSTLAGSPTGWGYEDGTGAAAKFDSIYGVCVSPSGAIRLCDANHVIRSVTPAGVVTTIAGSAPTAGLVNGTGTAARFDNPQGMAVNASGDLWVAESGNSVIRKVTAAGVVSTEAGSGTGGSVDGPAATAQFNTPRDVALDASGNLWVADTYNYTVRLISGGMVSTLAGTAGQSGNVDGTGAAARFSGVTGIVIDSAGNACLVDSNNSRIRMLTPTGIVTTVAGSSYGWQDGTGLAAKFRGPLSICADASGNYYIAEIYTNVIRKIAPGYVVSTLAGASTVSGSADGTGAAARFSFPSGVAANAAGTVFVADRENHTIRRITSSGVVTTIGGTAGIADAADGINGAARFSKPQRIAIGPDGTLYVTDASNRIVKGVPLPDITVQQPAGINLTDGKTLNFGPVTLTTTTVRTFTIRNDSDAVLTGLALSLNGTHAADFTATSLAVTSLAPGASTTFDITFHANVPGTRTAAVHITSNVPAKSPFDIVLTATVDNNLTVDLAPQSKVQTVGDSVTFQSHGSHPLYPVSYQWKKNGVNIPGAISSDLTLSGLTVGSAGTYTVVMTANGKSVSRSATLTMITPVLTKTVIAKLGSTVKLLVTNVKGPCVFLWKENGVALPNSNSNPLTLSAVTFTTTPTTYDCYAVRADLTEVPVASFSLVVFYAKPILAQGQNMLGGKVGSYYTHQIAVTGDPGFTPTSFGASGLPPGVTVNSKTGLISGTPTAGKTYTVTLSASNSYGTVSMTRSLMIDALPSGMVGTFNGITTGKGIQTGGLNARVDFTVASTGSITGSTIFSGVKYSFRGQVDTTGAKPTSTITIARTGLSSIQLKLVFDTLSERLDASSTLSTGFNTIGITGWRNVWRATAPVRLATTVAKRYNFALNSPGGVGLPEGSGYGSFILNTNGTLIVSGKTPEGDSFTTSSVVSPRGAIMVYQALYANQGVLIGLLDLDPTQTGLITDNLEGSLSWTRPANTASRYSPNGFTKLGLTAFGHTYTAPVAPGLILGMTLNSKAMLSFIGGNLSTASINPDIASFDILAGNKAVLPAALTTLNPGSVKFTTLNASTGQFSGSFTLSDNELRTGATYAGKKFVRTVTFSGLLTQDAMGHVGAGNFLLPELPTDTTPPTKTLIHSGYVQFQKKP